MGVAYYNWGDSILLLSLFTNNAYCSLLLKADKQPLNTSLTLAWLKIWYNKAIY